MKNFVLYSRSYCHLCEDMLHALEAYAPPSTATIEVVDIDADEDLVRQYDELVPVLMGIRPDGRPMKLCHYFLDRQAVDAFLAS